MISYKSNLTIIVMALLLSALVPLYTSLPQKSFIEPVYAQSTVSIMGAMVFVSGSNGSEYAITGSSGGYQIVEGLGTGEYSAVVMAKGYIDGKVEEIQVIAGQETSGINFLLKRSGAISGKITGPDSQPLKGILVYATQTQGTGGNASSYAVTNDDGSYFIYSGLSTGTYNVTAGFYSTGYISQTQSNINVVEVQETSNVNFQLEVSGTISGTVTTTEGIPLANVIVMAVSSDDNYYGFAYTDVNGNYRLDTNLGTGTYTVTAYKGMMPSISDVSVIAGQETANIDFQISITPSGSISGRVTDNSENPIQGATISASGTAGYGSAETDSNGYYIISEGLDTGSYTVSATASGYNPSSPINVTVTVNQETTNINFLLQKISGTTSGSISGQVNGESNPIVPPSTTSSTSTTSTSTTSTSTTSTSSSETTTSTTESSTTTSETSTTSSSTSTSITETTPFPWIYVIIGVVVVVIIVVAVFMLRMRKPKV